MSRLVPPLLVCSLLGAASDARADVVLTKGPWTMDARPTSAVVFAELSERAPVMVRASSADGHVVERGASAAVLHEVALEGLRPGLEYRYDVREGLGAEATRVLGNGRFRTAPSNPSAPITFLLFGDNRTDDAAHAAVVAQMLASGPADFLVGTGDLVEDGRNPEHWARMFRIQRELLAAQAFFPSLGNHELGVFGFGGASEYERYVRAPTDAGTERYYSFVWGNTQFFVLDSNDDWSRRGPQREWLERRLRVSADNSGVLHRFVVLHHGPFSSGAHGPNEGMLASELPALFAREGIDVVFSGHDHTYERGAATGIKYVVSGGGGAPLYPENRRLPHQAMFEAVHHFLRIRVEGPRVTMEVHRADGSRLETCSFELNGPWDCPRSPDAPAAGRDTRPSAPPVAEPAHADLWVLLGVAALAIGVTLLALRARRAR